MINVDVAKPADAVVAACPFYEVNLADAGATREAAARIARDFEVNCIVNNAGTPTPGFLEDVTDEAFDLGVNLTMRTPV